MVTKLAIESRVFCNLFHLHKAEHFQYSCPDFVHIERAKTSCPEGFETHEHSPAKSYIECSMVVSGAIATGEE